MPCDVTMIEGELISVVVRLVLPLPPARNSLTVPLSRQAVGILCEVHRLTGDGRYVFPSGRGGDRPMSDNAILAAMRRMGIAKEEMQIKLL